MLDNANCPSNCANHTAGFSGQKGGTRIQTRLMQKVESGGCSGCANGLASCCVGIASCCVGMASCCIVITPGSPLWLDMYECSCTLDTLHTIRAQSQCVSTVCTHYRSGPLLLISTRIACSLHTVLHNPPPDPLSCCLCPPAFSCCYLRPHCLWR
jgi:hypothetical protein